MGLLDALQDKGFRNDVADGLRNALNRGLLGGVLGAPVDLATMALRPLGYKVEQPVMGSEWIGQKLQDAGMVSNKRNHLAEMMAGLLDPATMATGAVKAGAGLAMLAGATKGAGRTADALNAAKPKLAQNELRSMRVNGKMADPNPVPQRSFQNDYPTQGIESQNGSRLTHDIDGNPLSPTSFIAGRNVAGRADSALGLDDTRRIAGLLGATERRASIGSDLGRFSVSRGKDGEQAREILLAKNLSDKDLPFVQAHETGHLIDGMVYGGKIPNDGIVNSLRKLYSDANSSLAVKDGKIGATPEMMGYSGQKADDELMAESLRMYMRDPNYMKSLYPDIAKRIRENVNQNQNLKDIIQFNSAAGAIGGGLLGQQYQKPSD